MTSYFAADDGNNSNDGLSAANPKRDIQNIFDTYTASTSSDQINVKGTHTMVSGGLVPWATSTGTGLVIRGYTAAENDGGKGIIDCDGFTFWNRPTNEGVYLRDLEVSNGSTTEPAVRTDRHCSIIACRFTNHVGGTGANAMVNLAGASATMIWGCQFDNISGDALILNNGHAVGCTFYCTATRQFDMGIHLAQSPSQHVQDCLFVLRGTAKGIAGLGPFTSTIIGNTFYSDDGLSEHGIHLTRPRGTVITNNYFEGFDVAAIYQTANTGETGCIHGYNAFFDNTLNVSVVGENVQVLGNDEILTATGLAKVGNALDPADRLTFFEPADSGNMRTGAYQA